MVVVMPDIHRDRIERAIVAVGLLFAVGQVVLLNPPRAQRMETDGEKSEAAR